MTTTADTTLRLERAFDAPREAVYRAWTTAEGLEAWYAPVDGWVTTVSELDVRVGGRYRISFGPDGGGRFTEAGEYRVVGPGARLVYTMVLTSPSGAVECETVVDVSFEDAPGGTLVRVVEEGYPTPDVRDRHQSGWGSFLERLARSLR